MPECACGPWIKLSMCGIGMFSRKTGELVSVACPSQLCAGMVPLVDGRLDDHSPVMPNPQPCPWAGVRVVDDRADFEARGIGVVRHE
ncbi:hypothetical protein [Nocardia vinacea]|uniref:hypothetical protein n=1 Tax=Nocardia vinacea TaxID=96468 RepID=UPI0012F66096|nr:hypothetical protein [Nocardia vinacea]